MGPDANLSSSLQPDGPPRSIRLFTVFFWFGTVISALADFYFWDANQPELTRELEAGSAPAIFLEAFIFAGLVAIYSVTILLWFFTAERRSRIARWLYIGFCLLGALSFALLAEDHVIAEKVTYGASALLGIASIICLFQRDSQLWFARSKQVDPRVFE